MVKGKEAINCENKQGNKRDDSITLCELTELDSHEKVEKLINTVIPTNIVRDLIKGEGIDNCLGGIEGCEVSSYEGEHIRQWTVPKGCTYPSDYGEKSLNHVEGVGDCKESLYKGKEVICNGQEKQTIMRYRAIKAKNRLFAVALWKGIYTV